MGGSRSRDNGIDTRACGEIGGKTRGGAERKRCEKVEILVRSSFPQIKIIYFEIDIIFS